MKRKFRLLIALLMLLLAFAVGAQAEVYLSNGTYSSYIGENSYLYLVDAAGNTKVMQTACKSLLSMDQTQLYCLTADNRLYSINLAASSTNLIATDPTQEAIAAVTAASPFALDASGNLTLTGIGGTTTAVATNVTMAGSNSVNLYYIDASTTPPTLKSYPLTSGTAGSSMLMPASSIIGTVGAGALSITATEEAVVIVNADHSLTVVNLQNNTMSNLAATSQNTAAAMVADGKLILYTRDASGQLQLETTLASSLVISTPTATPGPVVITAVPTATPTPKRTATPTPYKNNSSSSSNNDSTYATIYYGNTGRRVTNMQKRLQALGYPVGTVDGSFGDNTLVAVNLFQDMIGYREHNYASSSMLEKLYSKKAPTYDPYKKLVRGNSGLMTLTLQTRLFLLGYDPGDLDGVYGQKTLDAVTAFQNVNEYLIINNGTNVKLIKGEADSNTLRVLYSDAAIYNPGSASPTPIITMPPVIFPTVPPFTTPTAIPTVTNVPTNTPTAPTATAEPTTTPTDAATATPVVTPVATPTAFPDPGTKTNI